MSVVVGIDPGPTQSAFLVIDSDGSVVGHVVDNAEVLRALGSRTCGPRSIAIEVVESFGMPVGREVFQTCEWIGRFREALGREFDLRLGRKDVKRHLCGSLRAKDSNVRAALLDRYGGSRKTACGTKKAPGPLYGVSSHCWSALAVAVTARDMLVGSGASRDDRTFAVCGGPRVDDSPSTRSPGFSA